MTTTKKDLVKRLVATRMSKLLEIDSKIDYKKVLDNLYTNFEDKSIEDIVLYYNTTVTSGEQKVTVEQVSDLL